MTINAVSLGHVPFVLLADVALFHPLQFIVGLAAANSTAMAWQRAAVLKRDPFLMRHDGPIKPTLGFDWRSDHRCCGLLRTWTMRGEHRPHSDESDDAECDGLLSFRQFAAPVVNLPTLSDNAR